MRLSSRWRLTVDPSADPHAEAARYELSGRRLMAIFVLNEAISSSENCAGFRRHLARIQAGPERTKAIEVSGAVVAVHMVVAWVILIGSLIAPSYLAIWLGARLFPAFFNSRPEFSLLFLAGGLVWVLIAVIFQIKLFCRLWFAYLGLLREAYFLAADETLPSVLATHQFGKNYVRVREAFFARRYGLSRHVAAKRDA